VKYMRLVETDIRVGRQCPRCSRSFAPGDAVTLRVVRNVSRGEPGCGDWFAETVHCHCVERVVGGVVAASRLARSR
jgi:hypothetical protein